MAKDKTLQAIIKLKDEFSKPLKTIKGNMETLGKQVDKTKKDLADFNTGMKTVGKGAMLAGGAITAAVGGALVSCTKEAIKFESAFAGVKKTMDTTGMSTEEANKMFEEMRSEVIGLSTKIPKSADELAGIAEIAGQLGIQGKNDVMKFTETITRLSDSTNIAGEEGALSLAKFMNVAGVAINDIDRVGAVIVKLGNNSKTTEADIMNMATRLSDLKLIAGFSADQILAWSAGMSSAGIEAEMGGTAMKKMVTQMERATLNGTDSLQQFAKVAGVSASEFKQAFEKDASNATLMFIKGLGEVSKNGGSVSRVLDDLGIKEVRLRETMIKLAGSSDVVAKSLNMAKKEWKDNEALLKESSQRYETTESAIQLMKNQIAAAKIELGTAFLPIVSQVASWVGNLALKFNSLDPETRKTITNIALVVAGFGLALLIIGGLIMFIANLVTAFTVLAGVGTVLAGVIAFICSPVGLLILAMLALTLIVVKVRDAWVSNWNGMQDKVKEVCDKVKSWWKNLGDWFMKNPIVAAVVETGKKIAGKGKDGKRSAFGTKRVMGNDVPYKLHDGEKVLTRSEADRYEKGMGGGSPISISIDKLTVREEADVNKIAKEIVDRMARQRLAFAGGGY